MTNKNFSQEQQKYFESLKVKYQATGEHNNSIANVLYFILSKADLNQKLLDGEWMWLQEYKFFKPMNLILEEQKGREKTSLYNYQKYKFYISKYEIKGTLAYSINPYLMFMLCKLDSDNLLTGEDLDFLRSHKQTETLKIIEEINNFASLKERYFANSYKNLSLDSPLYSILKKLEKEQRLNDSEISWLKKHNLLETLEIYQKQEEERIANFTHLKSKYNATQVEDSSPENPLYSILQKLEQEQNLNETEINWLKENNLKETLAIIQEQENKKEFALLKIKYQATDYKDPSPTCHLYRVLKNIELGNLLNESDLKFLSKRNLIETIDLVQDKHLQQLKNEYYSINEFIQSDIDWLKHQDVLGIKPIDDHSRNQLEFALLKIKYQATDYKDPSPTCHLYRVLKNIELGNLVNESDINYLKKQKLTQTIKIVLDSYANGLMSKVESGQVLNEQELAWINQNGYEKLLIFTQEKHFIKLKKKYNVSNYLEKSTSAPLYIILQKLEREERLEGKDIIWLKETKVSQQGAFTDYYWSVENNLFSQEINLKYHSIEAQFYEEEYKSTGNKWNLPNASSHWRGAEQPEKALKITDNLNFEKIKDNKLKSALLTTRGGAFRDLNDLNQAEKCAKKAIEYYSQSYHPYTLMGAICYDSGNYLQGDDWFSEAIKRGYSPKDQEAEIKRIFYKVEQKQKLELAKYLKTRYTWAKKYLQNLKNKNTQM